MICLTLTGNSAAENIAAVERNRKNIDIAELRLDFLNKSDLKNLKELRKKIGIKTIATFRKKCDGGNYSGDEAFRRRILLKAVEAGFDYVDLEYGYEFREIEEKAEEVGAVIIRSLHNFEGVSIASDVVREMLSLGDKEIPKLALYPKTSKDVYELMKLYERFKIRKNKIILGMGECGFFTRILYKKLGSMLTFCSENGISAAPGHISPMELKKIYNIDRISSEPLVFGIIGNPVMHTLSPHLHNTGYRNLGLDAVYVPFPVDDLNYFFKIINVIDLRGFSVTVPFKRDIIPYLTESDSTVSRAGACNTVICRDGGFNGWNTDIEGFFEPLAERTDINKIRRIAVIGAGGAAGAVVKSLAQLDAEIHIFNRTVENARILAEKYGAFYHQVSDYKGISECGLVVQTTSVGMSPDIESTPLPGYTFRPDQVVYDLIYTPEHTRLLKDAEAAGCRVINGLEMLVVQGKKQFRLFTGYDYPDTGAYRELLRSLI